MSALKTVGVLGAVSGIGLIGYYLLNKTKPTISQEQKAELQGQLYVLKEDKPEYRKFWSIIAKYGSDNLSDGNYNNDYFLLINKLLTENPLVISDYQNGILKSALRDIKNKNGVSQEPTVLYSIIGEDLKKWLQNGGWRDIYFEKKKSVNTENLVEQKFTNRAYDYSVPFNKSVKGMPDDEYWKKISNTGLGKNIKSNWFFDNYRQYSLDEYSQYFESEPDPSGLGIQIIADNCKNLDYSIKTIQDRIAEQTKNRPNETHRRVLVWFKNILEDYFQFKGCRDTIEKQRLIDSAKSQAIFSIKAEDSILGENQKNQNIYLGVGALVLVVSTGLLLSTGKSTTPTSGSSKSSGLLGNLVIVGGLAGMGYLIFKKPKVYKSQNELTELLNKK
jgi:hypothetical protein